MGNFYTNITLRGPKPAEVLAYLAREGREAFVSPSSDGFLTVYDAECEHQDPRVLDELAAGLSRTFHCPALAVLNHDDDVFYLRVYENGRGVDEYDSSPDYFGFEAEGEEDSVVAPQGGDAAELCRLFGAGARPEDVEEVLRAPLFGEGTYLFAVERHAALIRALGLPTHSVGCGYHYLDAGQLPDGLSEDQLARVPQTGSA